ncbi:hypothetical protein ABIC33_003199 [Variovorax sp. 1140]|uniref:hypothetical protein n=1 Tax=Variovorax atrisoli TaxID=3394203 RepID=UPI003398C972
MGLFSRTPPPQRPLEIWENNPHFGMPFNTAVYQCETSEELAALVVGYRMSNKELDWYEERINQLMDREAMELYEGDAKQKAEEFVSRIYGRGHPEFAAMVEKQTKVEMETEWSIRQSLDATTKLQTLQMEREDGRHRQLIESIDNVAQTVEESSALAQGKKLVERHPFLTGLLGPSNVRKIFGR